MGSISFRESIRWLPDEGSEPTSTLVVTSPEGRFVDLRVLRPQGTEGAWPTTEEKILLDQLDWAIAGTSTSTKNEDGSRHTKFEHWIDSRTNEPETATDEGDMYPQSDNKTLEKGKMVNPATGAETEYEEVWHDVTPLSTNAGGKIKSFVLQFDNEAGLRGSIVRHGHYVQGFLKEGEKLTAERWEWKEEGKWGRLLKLGTEELPSMIVMDVLDHLDDEMHLRLGDAVKLGGRSWRVVELS